MIRIDDWNEVVCDCGNDTFRDGFYYCDEHGIEVEPVIEGPWIGHMACYDCGTIQMMDALHERHA